MISTQNDNAVLEIAGQRQTARVGGAPVSVGTAAGPGTGTRIVLSASTGGHFVSQGTINARPVQFLVDTGATTVGIGIADAERIGLNYKQGAPVHGSVSLINVVGGRRRISAARRAPVCVAA